MYNKFFNMCMIILIVKVNGVLLLSVCNLDECICEQEVNANYVTCNFEKNSSNITEKHKRRILNFKNFYDIDTFKVLLRKVNPNQLPKKLFSGLNIDYLLMNEISLNKLDLELFDESTSVKNFYLSNNNLTDMIEFYMFSYNLTTSIENLVLKNNSISKISSHSLNYLTSLNNLDLSHNQISDIDSRNDLNLNLKSLVSLDLSHNRIKSIDFRYFSNDLKNRLERLNLNSNGIKYLININDLIHLRYLLLSSNELDELHLMPVKKMTNLIKLDLSKNYFKRIQTHMIGFLKNLVKLDLSFNFITYFEGGVFSNFKNLEKLYLQNNYLKKVDLNWFKNCLHLNILDLSNNQIETIKDFDSHINILSNLKILRLSNNKLKSISFDHNHAFPYMKMFYLDQNYIKELNHHINLKYLIKFDLSNQHGQLKNLRNNLFKKGENSGNLLKLNISLNHNLVIDENTFFKENSTKQSYNLYLDLIISNKTLVNTNKCILKQLSNQFRRIRLFIMNDHNSVTDGKFSINETVCKCNFRLFLANFNILVRDVCPLYVTYCYNEEFNDDCISKNQPI